MKVALFLGNAGKNSGGPEVYELELLRNLARIDKVNEYHVYFLFAEGPAKAGFTQDNFEFHVLWPDNRAISLSITLPYLLRRLKPDAVHATFVPPLLVPPKTAYTLPCTAIFENPDYYPPDIRVRLRVLCGQGVKRSDKVICISEHIRDWLRANRGVPEERLPVVPLAANAAFRPMTPGERESVMEKYSIDYPYFLFSGRWEHRKNIHRVVEAFGEFKQNSKTPHKLLLTGARTWAAKEVDELIEHLGLQDDVVDLGKSPLDELPALYSGASALLYPSLWESFGLPIVEAMSTGTPVITSNIAAMPETAGGAARLVDPTKTSDIAAAIYELSHDTELHSDLRERGLERAKSFNWETTARKSMDVYARLAS